jgi:peptide-methionine (S)-S-oxide reductase
MGILEKATFGAGCFWGVEAAFRGIKGVVDTKVGYAGGSWKNPSYEEVCSERTGHAEVVEVEFDPNQISYQELLNIFWDIHDPTTLNRQGPDEGEQYRSVIFTHTPEQQSIAMKSREERERSGRFRHPIVTIIQPIPPFYKAEEYHQRYFEKTGRGGCHFKVR